MMRRKHHCRLCGGVMCEDCSDKVSFELAERLIHPATISDFNQDHDNTGENGQKSSASSPTKSKSKAQATYDGLVSNFFADTQNNFRSCQHCKEVLEQRDKRLRIKTAPDPALVKYYSHLRDLLREGEALSEKYRQMANRSSLAIYKYSL